MGPAGGGGVRGGLVGPISLPLAGRLVLLLLFFPPALVIPNYKRESFVKKKPKIIGSTVRFLLTSSSRHPLA